MKLHKHIPLLNLALAGSFTLSSMSGCENADNDQPTPSSENTTTADQIEEQPPPNFEMGETTYNPFNVDLPWYLRLVPQIESPEQYSDAWVEHRNMETAKHWIRQNFKPNLITPGEYIIRDRANGIVDKEINMFVLESNALGIEGLHYMAAVRLQPGGKWVCDKAVGFYTSNDQAGINASFGPELSTVYSIEENPYPKSEDDKTTYWLGASQEDLIKYRAGLEINYGTIPNKVIEKQLQAPHRPNLYFLRPDAYEEVLSALNKQENQVNTLGGAEEYKKQLTAFHELQLICLSKIPTTGDVLDFEQRYSNRGDSELMPQSLISPLSSDTFTQQNVSGDTTSLLQWIDKEYGKNAEPSDKDFFQKAGNEDDEIVTVFYAPGRSLYESDIGHPLTSFKDNELISYTGTLPNNDPESEDYGYHDGLLVFKSGIQYKGRFFNWHPWGFGEIAIQRKKQNGEDFFRIIGSGIFESGVAQGHVTFNKTNPHLPDFIADYKNGVAQKVAQKHARIGGWPVGVIQTREDGKVVTNVSPFKFIEGSTSLLIESDGKDFKITTHDDEITMYGSFREDAAINVNSIQDMLKLTDPNVIVKYKDFTLIGEVDPDRLFVKGKARIFADRRWQDTTVEADGKFTYTIKGKTVIRQKKDFLSKVGQILDIMGQVAVAGVNEVGRWTQELAEEIGALGGVDEENVNVNIYVQEDYPLGDTKTKPKENTQNNDNHNTNTTSPQPNEDEDLEARPYVHIDEDKYFLWDKRLDEIIMPLSEDWDFANTRPYEFTFGPAWPGGIQGAPTESGIIRGEDGHGAGFFGGSRVEKDKTGKFVIGRRVHTGTDYLVAPGKKIFSTVEGTVVQIWEQTKNGKKTGLKGVFITDNQGEGRQARFLYVKTDLKVGDAVKPRDVVGIAQDISLVYKAVPNHIHATYVNKTGDIYYSPDGQKYVPEWERVVYYKDKDTTHPTFPNLNPKPRDKLPPGPN